MKRLLFGLLVISLLLIISPANAKLSKPKKIKGYTTHFNFYTKKKH